MKIKLGLLRRLINEIMIRETDERMVGDDAGNGTPDLDGPEDLADHLRGADDANALILGDDDDLTEELHKYFLQEDVPGDAPTSDVPGAVEDAVPDTMGFYTPFDMNRDHMGTDNPNGTWYRSPGQPVGDSDPFRSSDPYAQLGFHPPAGPNDPAASPPGVTGEEPATGGASTDDGANAPDADVESDNGSEEEEPKKQA